MNSRAQAEIPWLIRTWWRVPLFAFCFLSIGMGTTLPFHYVLSKRGKTVEATITGEYGHKKKMVTCQYEVNGNTYTSCASTPNDFLHSPVEYSPALIGAKVLITYDPVNPKDSLDGDRREKFAGDFCRDLIGVFLACLFFAFTSRLARRDFLAKNFPWS